MSLVLRVTPQQQVSPNSCWWACLRMALAYYGQNHIRPEDYRSAFRRPASALRPISPVPDIDPDTGVTEPYEWFGRGIPLGRCFGQWVGDKGLQKLCSITGFRPLRARPAFGGWTNQVVEEALRDYGPFIFIGNWNRQGFHAVIVTGRRIRDWRTRDEVDEVVYIDPAMGAELGVSNFFFNSMMASISTSPYNPLHVPATPQVGATVMDRREVPAFVHFRP